ncbi:GNAT family N-acetyltransferase [Falsihalocynthiibacter sp. SS001]|uniref:GNAT family N-acetyltransferase n=1 Tax=Falsihalocynthiibacter sp. SS001 TaxID=3349698 RepID=UPI0036D217CA
MTAPTIISATAKDSHAIRECIQAAFAPMIAEISDFPDVTHGLEDSIEKGEVFAAMDAGDVAGVLVIDVQETFLKVSIVAVDPARKGQGLGRRLMEYAEKRAQQLGLAEMRLRTHALMPQNVTLYEHLGWRVTGRDERAVSMSKPL